MRAYNPLFKWDIERFEHFFGSGHNFVVTGGAHYDSDFHTIKDFRVRFI